MQWEDQNNRPQDAAGIRALAQLRKLRGCHLVLHEANTGAASALGCAAMLDAALTFTASPEIICLDDRLR